MCLLPITDALPLKAALHNSVLGEKVPTQVIVGALPLKTVLHNAILEKKVLTQSYYRRPSTQDCLCNIQHMGKRCLRMATADALPLENVLISLEVPIQSYC